MFLQSAACDTNVCRQTNCYRLLDVFVLALLKSNPAMEVEVLTRSMSNGLASYAAASMILPVLDLVRKSLIGSVVGALIASKRVPFSGSISKSPACSLSLVL